MPNHHHAITQVPPRAEPDEPVLHADGIFFLTLCILSWAVYWIRFVFWAWNHKPKVKLARRPSVWEMPSKHWRN